MDARRAGTSHFRVDSKNLHCAKKKMAMTESKVEKRNTFAIKAEISNLYAGTFAFSEQKTMYGGKYIASSDGFGGFDEQLGASSELR